MTMSFSAAGCCSPTTAGRVVSMSSITILPPSAKAEKSTLVTCFRSSTIQCAKRERAQTELSSTTAHFERTDREFPHRPRSRETPNFQLRDPSFCAADQRSESALSFLRRGKDEKITAVIQEWSNWRNGRLNFDWGRNQALSVRDHRASLWFAITSVLFWVH